MDVVTQLALGGVKISLTHARPLRCLNAGLVVPGNMRGVMAAGFAGEVRVLAGRGIEDELLSHRPFSIGNAYPTSGGKLITAGVEALAHAISTSEPGESPRATDSERSLRSALALFEEIGVRSATLPLIETVSGDSDRTRQGRAFGALLAGHLRRRSRLRDVTVAGLDHEFLSGLGAWLIESGAIPILD